MYSISDNLEHNKAKIEWDKVIEKGERVTVNEYMIGIIKDLTSMHKVLHNILPK